MSLWEDEPDPQEQTTDSSLFASPDDWIKEGYTLEQRLRAPRGALFETRLEASRVLREEGNSQFATKAYEKALEIYGRAFWHVDFELGYVQIEMTEYHQLQVFQVQVPVRLNMAQCLLALKTEGDGKVADAKQHADAAYKLCDQYGLDKWKAKALYWRAKATLETGAYDAAEADFVAAAALEPSDKLLRNAIADVRRLRKELRADQKALFDGKLGPVKHDGDNQRRICIVS